MVDAPQVFPLYEEAARTPFAGYISHRTRPSLP